MRAFHASPREVRHRNERLRGNLAPCAPPLGVSASLVQYVDDWREAHAEIISHLSIAEELAELSSPLASLLIDRRALFWNGWLPTAAYHAFRACDSSIGSVMRLQRSL